MLPSGHIIDVLVDSVLGTDGQGYFLARILHLFGWSRYTERAVGSKTFTYKPRRGNYRWWFPFSAVLIWFVKGFGFFKINRWGWTNEGMERWISERYPTLAKTTQSPIANIGPDNICEAAVMAQRLSQLHLAAVIVSVGCANVKTRTTGQSVAIVKTVMRFSAHPVIVKLSAEQDYIAIARALEGTGVVLQITNTLHWSTVFGSKRKPFGQDWAVSGPPIREFGLKAVRELRSAGIEAKIVGGGGITCYRDVEAYLNAGANAVYVSTSYRERRAQQWAVRLHSEYCKSLKASAV